MNLLGCPFCGSSVSFHQHADECVEGCHNIECKNCGLFDMSNAADPQNECQTLEELRARIVPQWNRRQYDPAAQPTDAEIKECLDSTDFSGMVTTDDFLYVCARAVLKQFGNHVPPKPLL